MFDGYARCYVRGPRVQISRPLFGVVCYEACLWHIPRYVWNMPSQTSADVLLRFITETLVVCSKACVLGCCLVLVHAFVIYLMEVEVAGSELACEAVLPQCLEEVGPLKCRNCAVCSPATPNVPICTNIKDLMVSGIWGLFMGSWGGAGCWVGAGSNICVEEADRASREEPSLERSR